MDAMPAKAFWCVIGNTNKHEADPEAQINQLRAILATLPADDVARFDIAFEKEMKRSYTWDLWGAAYVVHGGASDDGFDYFRHWLISKGEHIYKLTLQTPDDLADALVPNVEGVLEFEEISYVAGEVWSDQTGKDVSEMPYDSNWTRITEPAGVQFEEDNAHLAARYPKLWARFGDAPLG